MPAQPISLFPLGTDAGAIPSYREPAPFVVLKPCVVYLPGLILFGMGQTLAHQSLVSVECRPSIAAAGPALAWLIALTIRLPPRPWAVTVLVAASPGGRASSVICYLACGNVAL